MNDAGDFIETLLSWFAQSGSLGDVARKLRDLESKDGLERKPELHIPDYPPETAGSHGPHPSLPVKVIK